MVPMTPYVGVTGITSIDEARAVRDEFHYAGYKMHTEHMPMIGILVSYKTLNGLATTNRRYPRIENVESLVDEIRKDSLAMIHYNSRELDTLADQVAKMFEYTHNSCRALQLNIPWPDKREISKITLRFPQAKIVLQLSQTAMKGKTPKEIATGVDRYGSLVDYALIDPSGGKGLEFDIQNSLEVYAEISRLQLPLAVGFAGGFTGENVQERTRLLAEKIGSRFCIDAEGGLRDKITAEYGDDTLNMGKVREYLQEARKILK